MKKTNRNFNKKELKKIELHKKINNFKYLAKK